MLSEPFGVRGLLPTVDVERGDDTVTGVPAHMGRAGCAADGGAGLDAALHRRP